MRLVGGHVYDRSTDMLKCAQNAQKSLIMSTQRDRQKRTKFGLRSFCTTQYLILIIPDLVISILAEFKLYLGWVQSYEHGVLLFMSMSMNVRRRWS